MKHFLVIFFSFISLNAAAQTPPANSPMMSPTANGQFNVTVMQQQDRGQQVLANQDVALEVGYQGMMVLNLPKKTDAEGKVQFRFIESNPSYSYALSTKFSGKTFRSELLQRTAEEKEKNIKIIVGPNLPTGPESYEAAFAAKNGGTEAPAGSAPEQKIDTTKKSEFSFTWWQTLSLVNFAMIFVLLFKKNA